jgi:hypothetical protein
VDIDEFFDMLMTRWCEYTNNGLNELEGLYYVMCIIHGISPNQAMSWNIMNQLIITSAPQTSLRSRVIIARLSWQSSSTTHGVTSAIVRPLAYVNVCY